jgi:PST family polysaccharide transporter
MNDSALSKSARGSAYNIAVTAVTIVLGFTRSVLLMRMLSPDDYGVFSLALFFVTILIPFSVLGIDMALIQKKTPQTGDFSTHFSLRLGLSITLLIFGLLLSPLLRKIYADQVMVVDVFLVLLVFNIIQASSSTPNLILRREMRFGVLAAINLSASLAMTIVAPLLAFLGAGIWSLVAELATSQIIRWIGFWLVLRPWSISFQFILEKARSLIKFGSHVLSSQVLGIGLDRFDDFWTGTYLGSTALGYYSRAYDMAQYPMRILATPLTNVFFPTYASIQDDKDMLSKAFFRSSSFLVRVGFLFTVVLMATAKEFTLILFGEKWLPIVPIFQLMLIYVLLNPLYENLSYLVVGVGKPRILARVRMVQVSVFIVTVILFAYVWSTRGVAIAANLMMLIGTLSLLLLSRQFVSYSMRKLFLWPTVASALSGIFAFILINFVQSMSLWLSLIIKALLVGGLYCLVLYLTERDVIHDYGKQSIILIRQQFGAKKLNSS